MKPNKSNLERLKAFRKLLRNYIAIARSEDLVEKRNADDLHDELIEAWIGISDLVDSCYDVTRHSLDILIRTRWLDDDEIERRVFANAETQFNDIILKIGKENPSGSSATYLIENGIDAESCKDVISGTTLDEYRAIQAQGPFLTATDLAESPKEKIDHFESEHLIELTHQICDVLLKHCEDIRKSTGYGINGKTDWFRKLHSAEYYIEAAAKLYNVPGAQIISVFRNQGPWDIDAANLVDAIRELRSRIANVHLKKSIQSIEQHENKSTDTETKASDDFTSVIWFGTRYTFKKGNQAESIKALYKSWENGTNSLSQATIAEMIEAAPDNFKMAKVFKHHPAYNVMIQSISKGVFGLFPEKSPKNPQ